MNFIIFYIKRVKRFVFSYIVRRRACSCGKDLKVNNRSYVSDNTILGDNVNFNGMRISGNGKVTIGSNFHSGQNCKMITQNHNYDKGASIPYDDTYIVKEITIGDNVWIGDNVIILGGVSIGEGAIIQAGGVVVSDIPPCGIAGGNPAKVFKYRDKEHYYSLKEEKKYH